MPRTEAQKRRHKRVYEERKAAQLCVNCGGPQDRTDRLLCILCEGKRKTYRQSHNGKCHYGKSCDQPAVPGKTRCLFHLNVDAQKAQKRRDKAKQTGLCLDCGKPRGDSINNCWCDDCRRRNLNNQKSRINRMRDLVFEHYGGYQCACCGETIKQFLSLDHINGGGNKHREEIGKRTHQHLNWIIDNDFPPIYQILCLNCNIGRAKNGGICPHQQYGYDTRLPINTRF